MACGRIATWKAIPLAMHGPGIEAKQPQKVSQGKGTLLAVAIAPPEGLVVRVKAVATAVGHALSNQQAGLFDDRPALGTRLP
jgi:hypothetical protein